MVIIMKTERFWLSFSLNGKPQGVVVVKATTHILAVNKAKELKIIPKNDDIAIYMLVDGEDLVPENILLSVEDMAKLGYDTTEDYTEKLFSSDDILRGEYLAHTDLSD